MICVKCGKIIEFQCEQIEKLQERKAAEQKMAKDLARLDAEKREAAKKLQAAENRLKEQYPHQHNKPLA